MIKIICTRKIETECFEVLMNIGKEDSRPELISVLKLAEEQNGIIMPKDISDRLLGGRPVIVGRQIIFRLVEIGVLETIRGQDKYKLTELGRETLESEKVLIPERGVYKAWFSDDPLFPSGLVDIQYSNPPDLREEVRKMNEAYKNGKEREDKLINIESLNIIENKRHIIVVGDHDLKPGGSVFVYVLGKSGFRRANSDRKLDSVLNITPNNTTRLTVGTESKRISIPSLEIDFNKLMSMMADSNWGEWKKDFIDIFNFDELDNISRRNFVLKRFNVKDFELFSLVNKESLGSWNIDIFEIPIDTTNSQLAGNWGLWLLKDSINHHINPNDYDKLSLKIIEKFKRGISIDLPSQQELVNDVQAEENTELFWHLQSSLDLNPGGVS